jgi:hypothetical protein
MGFLQFVLQFLPGFAAIITLVIAYHYYIDDLLKITPVGTAKQWIWTLVTGHGFAICFTNLGDKCYEWQLGFFKITK